MTRLPTGGSSRAAGRPQSCFCHANAHTHDVMCHALHDTDPDTAGACMLQDLKSERADGPLKDEAGCMETERCPACRGGWGQQRGGRQPQRQQQQHPQGGGGGGDWRAVVHDDIRNERPAWPFSSYGHERGGNCDLLGDFSFEEVCAY